MSEHFLILHPADPHTAPEREPLLARLRDCGLIGAPLAESDGARFAPGDNFLELITFLGCSPVVALGAPGSTGESFCHIGVAGSSSAPRFYGGDNVKPPACPACRQRLSGWREAVREWEASGRQGGWRCSSCGELQPFTALNWRRSAGVARLFIEIAGVFESEAIPADALWDVLDGVGVGPWRHFYSRFDR